MTRVADMHAEVVVDDVQLVGVDVERAPLSVLLRRRITTARTRCSKAGRV